MLSRRLPQVALDSSMARIPLPLVAILLAVAMSSSSYLPARTTTAARRERPAAAAGALKALFCRRAMVE
jgi:hypothetical protein